MSPITTIHTIDKQLATTNHGSRKPKSPCKICGGGHHANLYPTLPKIHRVHFYTKRSPTFKQPIHYKS